MNFTADDEFQSLCFQFGLELDEVVDDGETNDNEGTSSGASEEIVYRIYVPANRYDLLSLEGLITGLQIFQDKAKIVLDTLVCALSQYCETKYTAESVKVVYPDRKSCLYPELNYRMEDYG